MKWMIRMLVGFAATALMSGCGPVYEEEAPQSLGQTQNEIVVKNCEETCPFSGPCTTRDGYRGEMDCNAYCYPVCIPY